MIRDHYTGVLPMIYHNCGRPRAPLRVTDVTRGGCTSLGNSFLKPPRIEISEHFDQYHGKQSVSLDSIILTAGGFTSVCRFILPFDDVSQTVLIFRARSELIETLAGLDRYRRFAPEWRTGACRCVRHDVAA